MVKLKISKRAYDDLSEIVGFIAEDNESAARSFYHKIIAATNMLADFPKAGRLRPEFGKRLRSFPVSEHLIFYRETSKTVEILRVLHGARDFRRIFEK